MTETLTQQVDQQLITALGHPLRQRLLILLDKRGVASPRELAELSGERLGNVSYHVRVLRDAGRREVVWTEPRRGAVEHFYRATARPMLDDRQWRSCPSRPDASSSARRCGICGATRSWPPRAPGSTTSRRT